MPPRAGCGDRRRSDAGRGSTLNVVYCFRAHTTTWLRYNALRTHGRTQNNVWIIPPRVNACRHHRRADTPTKVNRSGDVNNTDSGYAFTPKLSRRRGKKNHNEKTPRGSADDRYYSTDENRTWITPARSRPGRSITKQIQ